MTMQDIVAQISFQLGFPANRNVEGLDLQQAVQIAFRELKAYMKTPVHKTVPYATRLDLKALEVDTVKVLAVYPAYPKLGMNLTSIEAGNVFQVAAAVNVSNGFAQGSILNIDPIMTELALSQVRNTLATDFQWKYDLPNQCVYCTCRQSVPAVVTISYVPEYHDVSEITNNTWIDYLVRLALAHAKVALGRTRSKYTIEGSNVTLDGETLLNEGNSELETMREELNTKRSRLVIVN